MDLKKELELFVGSTAETRDQLKSWWESVRDAAEMGYGAANAFNLGLFYGETGRERVPARYLEPDGKFQDDIEFAFNIGSQWHEIWVEVDAAVRPVLIQILVQTALEILKSAVGGGKK